MTLIELVTALAIAGVVTSSLYLLVGAGIKGYLIAHARISDQAHARQALFWVADRIRQAADDPLQPCPDRFLRIGDGAGFSERLAFRAVLDERLTPPRRTYAYYVDGGTLWEETRDQESRTQCSEEAGRTRPDSGRVALTPSVVRAFRLTYLDQRGISTSTPALVRAVQISLTVETASVSGRLESQSYQTVVGVRGP